MANITITILTKNSARTLHNTLKSTEGFAEVLVLDTGSTDDTLSICKEFPNVTVYHRPFEGFGPTHNTASNLAKTDWILSIDSDEILTQELKDELHSLKLSNDTLYEIRRHNYFNEKRITTCSGWDPDYVVRLYNRTRTSFSSDAVHEKVLKKDLAVKRLTGALVHTPYLEISDFLHKMQNYSTLFAMQNASKEKNSVIKALLHGYMAFFKSYILKKGFLQGKEGFVISLYNSHCTFYKYLKTSNLCQKG